jgi:hypothetical protein
MGPLHEHHSTGKLGQEVTAVIMFVPDQWSQWHLQTIRKYNDITLSLLFFG